MQYAPRLLRHLKPAADAARERYVQYLLIGSQKFALTKGVSESLAGPATVSRLGKDCVRYQFRTFRDCLV